MDKNNDIKVNKISKWDAAPVSIKNLRNYILESWKNYAAPPCCPPLDPSDQDAICEDMMQLLESVLDDYNELEAKYQEACGMISEYEEENRELHLNISNANAFYKKLQTEYCDIIEMDLNQQRHKRFNDLKSKIAKLEKEKNDLEDQLARQKRGDLWEFMEKNRRISDLEADNRDLEVQARVNASTASAYESEIKQIIDLAKSYGLIIYDDRKDAIPDDVLNIGMCGHYYVLDRDIKNENQHLRDRCNELAYRAGKYEEENCRLRNQRKRLKIAHIKLTGDNDYLRQECDRHIDLLDKLRRALEDKGISCEWNEAALEWRLYGKNELIDELKQHYEEELRIREKEKDEKDKLIDELNSKIMMLKLRTNAMYGCYGLNSKYGELLKKIEALEKENKVLKDTIEKDGEFGRNVGECVADSIREGCDKGVYKLHPLTRIDIHVEETNNMPMTFDRHAIPRIAVMFNNTQTEMERDTAQHECEELEKENKDLKQILERCEWDANAARNLCHTIAFNAERARNNIP